MRLRIHTNLFYSISAVESLVQPNADAMLWDRWESTHLSRNLLVLHCIDRPRRSDIGLSSRTHCSSFTRKRNEFTQWIRCSINIHVIWLSRRARIPWKKNVNLLSIFLKLHNWPSFVSAHQHGCWISLGLLLLIRVQELISLVWWITLKLGEMRRTAESVIKFKVDK